MKLVYYLVGETRSSRSVSPGMGADMEVIALALSLI